MGWIRCEWIAGIGPAISILGEKKKYSLCLCHHKKERSVPFFGIENYLCARCLGIVIGGMLGIPALLAGVILPLYLSVLLAMPLVIDGFLQLLTPYESRNSTRLITGFLFGIAVYYIGYDLIVLV